MKRFRIKHFTAKNLQCRSGRYCVRYKDPRTGKKPYYYFGYDKQEAIKALPAFNQMLQNFKTSDRTYQATIQQGIDYWFDKFVNKKKNEGTKQRYRQIMNNFKSFLIEKYPDLKLLEDVDKKHYEDFRDYETKNGKAPRTVNYELETLSTWSDFLFKEKYLSHNKVKSVDKEEESYIEERWFSIEEVKVLFEAAKQDPMTRLGEIDWYGIFATFFYTGMRKGELENLWWDDIRWEQGIILIKPKADWKTKTKTSIRSIPIHPQLLPILKALPKKSSRYVFPNSQGKKFGKNEIRDKLRKLCKNAGIPMGKVHSWRHTWCAHSIMGGANKATVQKIGGWKDSEMVDHYSKLQRTLWLTILTKVEFLRDVLRTQREN